MDYQNKFANNTTNIVEPTQDLWDKGIELKSEARSSVVNGVLQAISEKSLQTENTVAEKVIEVDTKLNRFDNIFTFVVDSQANFEKWLNNVRDNGEDYTSVLVKSGTWTATKGLNLTTAGTKVIEGQAGNKLQFSLSGSGEQEDQKGIFYDTIPTSPEYRIDGLNVEARNNTLGFSNPECQGFSNCSNLTNCQGSASSSTTSNEYDYDYIYAYGFSNCSNLTNCQGSASSSVTAGAECQGFSNCSNLTNCQGSASSSTTSNEYDYDYIYAYGFSNCSNLTNCQGSSSSSAPNMNSNSYAYGFSNCSNLTNCQGAATADNSPLGFKNCKQAILNHGTASDCYSTKQTSSTYAWADTPNGGFNDTTEWTP